MPHFDTSSLIYAWDNYPIENLPKIWEWLRGEIEEHRIVFSSVVEEEVERNSRPCSEWLKSGNPRWLIPTQTILEEATRLKNMLGIVEDRYGAGVNENDLIIIATAKAFGEPLVTNESRQSPAPKGKPQNYKIPLVCNQPTVQVKPMDFLEYFRTSGKVF